MSQDANSLVISTLARSATSQLRDVIKHADRDTARPIYTELLRIAHEMARTHDFQLERGKRVREDQAQYLDVPQYLNVPEHR